MTPLPAVALYFQGKYREAWEEVRQARKLGGNVHPGFLEALRNKMPEPK